MRREIMRVLNAHPEGLTSDQVWEHLTMLETGPREVWNMLVGMHIGRSIKRVRVNGKTIWKGLGYES